MSFSLRDDVYKFFVILKYKNSTMSDDSGALTIVSSLVDELITESTQSKKKGKETIKILVGSISWDGLWTFHVTQDTKINRIKILTLFELFGNEFDIHVNYYMLTFPAAKRSLHESKTVKEEHLKNDDILELVKLPASDELLIQFVQHISENTVTKETSHLPQPDFRNKLCNVVLDIQPPEFMSDVRKIMITLIEYSLTIMSTKPNARYIFDVVRRKLMSENFFIDDGMLNKYSSTGASTRRVKFAISASYNDPFSVNEWLEETRSIASEDLGIPDTFHIEDSLSLDNELNGLLKLFRQYLRASFKVCSKATEHLIEMGFEHENIKKALRYTGNSTSEAVQYLVGNLDLDNDGAKPGLDCGMSVTSDMYKEIMREKEIIIPLSNPSVLYACLSVMDANSFLVSSIRFPTIMNLLNKILTTYYVSKCDMAMKQMMGENPND